MVKVSGALSGQIMVMYHHCAVPGPPRAASGPHGLRDGINRYFPAFSEKSKRLGVVPRVIKELWDVPPYSPTCILYITILIWAHNIPLPSDTMATVRSRGCCQSWVKATAGEVTSACTFYFIQPRPAVRPRRRTQYKMH